MALWWLGSPAEAPLDPNSRETYPTPGTGTLSRRARCWERGNTASSHRVSTHRSVVICVVALGLRGSRFRACRARSCSRRATGRALWCASRRPFFSRGPAESESLPLGVVPLLGGQHLGDCSSAVAWWAAPPRLQQCLLTLYAGPCDTLGRAERVRPRRLSHALSAHLNAARSRRGER